MKPVQSPRIIEGTATFTQSARRSQLVACTIDALATVGYQQTSVAEVARRAKVSKGVVTYHFPARDDLIWAVVADVFESIADKVGSQIEHVPPDRFTSTYLGSWIDYYFSERQRMFAIAEIWTNFRDSEGRLRLDAATLSHERLLVETVLGAGQSDGSLGDFSPRVVAVSMKAALDGLLGQLAVEPDLDLAAYGDELVLLFERATTAARIGSRTSAISHTRREKKP